jgi:hypothetical protein
MIIFISSSLLLSKFSHFYDLFSYVFFKTNYLENHFHILFLLSCLIHSKRTASLCHYLGKESSGLDFPKYNPGQ